MENRKMSTKELALFWWDGLPKTVKSILLQQHSLHLNYHHYTEKEKIIILYQIEVEENCGIINMFNRLIPKSN